MKTYTQKIAQVGANDPFSENDLCRVVLCITKLRALLAIYRDHAYDIINLNYGRDFLTERKKYDIVIVHSVFHFDFINAKQRLGSNVKELSISPKHSVNAWRNRLQSTNAKYICVCEGQSACLSGWNLGDIDGYNLTDIDHLVAIYCKI